MEERAVVIIYLQIPKPVCSSHVEEPQVCKAIQCLWRGSSLIPHGLRPLSPHPRVLVTAYGCYLSTSVILAFGFGAPGQPTSVFQRARQKVSGENCLPARLRSQVSLIVSILYSIASKTRPHNVPFLRLEVNKHVCCDKSTHIQKKDIFDKDPERAMICWETAIKKTLKRTLILFKRQPKITEHDCS
jgi:hypothetical protein